MPESKENQGIPEEQDEPTPPNIDKSQWLDKETPIITEERRQKGDIYTEGPDQARCPPALEDIIYARSFIKNILRYLWTGGHLTDQQWEDGNTYAIWQILCSSNFGKLAAQSFRQVRSAMDASGLNEYGYILLLKSMRPDYLKRINYAVNITATNHEQSLATRDVIHFQNAFAELEKKMQSIRDKLKALADMDPVAKQQLVEDNLKKLVADLKNPSNNENTVRP